MEAIGLALLLWFTWLGIKAIVMYHDELNNSTQPWNVQRQNELNKRRNKNNG